MSTDDGLHNRFGGHELIHTPKSCADCIRDIEDGSTVMVGGFGGSGAPIELIHAMIDRFRAIGSPNALTIINNNAGSGEIGLAAMIREGMVKKLVCSFPRSSDPRAFNEAYNAGEIALELVPQGTLAERIRAAGTGMPAFYTATGVGTELAKGKKIEVFSGREYIRETALPADFAIIKAHRADALGNLTYNKSARNFGPLMAMAATVAIAQCSEVVPAGDIDPETIVTPGVFVQRIALVANPEQEEDLRRKGCSYP